jgi:GDSL-like Lipase/Acylhydrolase family
MTHESEQAMKPVSQAKLRILAAIVGVVFAMLLGWVSGEIYVRMTRPHLDIDILRGNSLEYEPTVFSRHAFPKRVQIKGEHKEDTINERGYRGPSFQVPKPPGVVRVVMLGGSSTYDPYAMAGQDWPHRAEAKLREMGFPQVEVINAGTPGHASWDSLGRLYAEIWMFEPDFVVICHGWNDIVYFRWLSPDKSLLRGYRPATELARSQVVDNPFMYYRGTIDRVLSNSQLYAHLRWRFFEWRSGLLDEEGLFRLGTRTARKTGRYADTQDTYSEWGPRQFELDLRLLVDAARDIGATPVLLTQPRLLSPPTNQIEEKRIPWGSVGLTAAALGRAFTDVDQATHRVGNEKRATVVDLAAKFNEQPDLFIRHVHLSPAGSDAIGTAVAEGLAPMIRASRTTHGAAESGGSGIAPRGATAGDLRGAAPSKASESKPGG